MDFLVVGHPGVTPRLYFNQIIHIVLKTDKDLIWSVIKFMNIMNKYIFNASWYVILDVFFFYIF